MVIDTFPKFLELWGRICDLPVQAQVEHWASCMAGWPEVLTLLTQDYTAQGLDWREIAERLVFPSLAQRLPHMKIAHRHLLELCDPVHAAARERLGLDCEIVFFIYVGIGCGAGWATRYDDTPAVLLGLENIAEEGWHERETLTGLLAHEIGHLALYHWRASPPGAGPWWELYDEGFAMECERIITGGDEWHLTRSEPAGWQDWCRENIGLLAAEFLKRANTGGDTRPFFGSWFEFHGYRYCGYFLGHQLIAQLAKSGKTLKEIAALDDIEGWLRPYLTRIARRAEVTARPH